MMAHSHTSRGWFQQGKPDKKCCVCTAPPRLLRFTRGPLRITSKWGQVVRLSRLCSLRTSRSHLFHWTLLGAKGWALNYLWFFLAHSHWETTVNTEIRGHILQMDCVVQALPSEQQRLKYTSITLQSWGKITSLEVISWTLLKILALNDGFYSCITVILKK